MPALSRVAVRVSRAAFCFYVFAYRTARIACQFPQIAWQRLRVAFRVSRGAGRVPDVTCRVHNLRVLRVACRVQQVAKHVPRLAWQIIACRVSRDFINDAIKQMLHERVLRDGGVGGKQETPFRATEGREKGPSPTFAGSGSLKQVMAL